MVKFYQPVPDPELSKYISPGQVLQTATWNMDPTGLTVPTEKHLHAITWFGKKLTNRGEFPIILALRNVLQHPTFQNGEWYCGIGNEAGVAGAKEPVVVLYESADMLVNSAELAVDAMRALLPDHDLVHDSPVLAGIQ